MLGHPHEILMTVKDLSMYWIAQRIVFCLLALQGACGVAVAGWPSGPGWSPPGQGDTVMGGVPTYDMTAGDIDKLSEAFDLFAQHDPLAAATMFQGWTSGAIGFVGINYELSSYTGEWRPAVADMNTVGFRFSSLSVTELAALLMHEWTHFNQWGGLGRILHTRWLVFRGLPLLACTGLWRPT